MTGSKLYQNGSEIFSASDLSDLVLTKSLATEFISAALVTKNRIYMHSNVNGKLLDLNFSSQDTILSLSVGDLKNNGENYIIFTNGRNVEAINLTGALADNFSFADPLGIGFTGTPLIADFIGDSKSEIIAATKDGRIFAIDGGTGKVVDGFPISTGSELSCTPILFT